ncbi:protein qui-1-like [Oppia nitens]|uniref:protein qui-1-like n=1 Tax=Oppia nitens TaxID=1686743 RepID=UPI0023D98127|nr:protein qui-1-like [Oppia nitens]
MSTSSAVTTICDPNEILHLILHGNITKGFPDPPSRVVKLFIGSTKADFDCERRHIHDVVIPELQRYCNSLSLDLLIIDPQWRSTSSLTTSHSTIYLDTGSAAQLRSPSVPKSPSLAAQQLFYECNTESVNPHEFALQMQEIDDCFRQSLTTFFLCLIGHKYKPMALPTCISSSDFKHIYAVANEAGLGDVSLLKQCYRENQNLYPSAQYSLVRPRRPSRQHEEEMEIIAKIVEYGAKVAQREGNLSENFEPLLSAVHRQILHALKLVKTHNNNNNNNNNNNTTASCVASDRLLCFIRQFEGVDFGHASVSQYFDVTPTTASTPMTGSSSSATGAGAAIECSATAIQGVHQLIDDVICGLKRGNIHYFNISWDEESTRKHENNDELTTTSTAATTVYTLSSDYLDKFGTTLLNSLRTGIDNHMNRTAFEYPAEVICESHSHLCNFRNIIGAIGVSQSIDSDCAPLLQIQKLIASANASPRHAPIVVTGKEGVGKTTFLSQVFTHSTEWLVGGEEVIRIVRHIGQSPGSSYISELLRNLCLHISLVFGFEAQTTISYDLSALSIWFQDLLKMVETTSENTDLIIILDDIHLMWSTQATALLGWLPFNLPANVHLICSVAETADEVLSLLRSRISADNFIRLTPIANANSFISTLQCKLRDEKHNLTADQWSVIRERFSNSYFQQTHTTPLYANLLSCTLLTDWESFYEPTIASIPSDINGIVAHTVSDLEDRFGLALIRKICSYLCCTRYGLREVEIYDLVINDDCIADANANTWLAIKEQLTPLWKQYYVLGRNYIKWKNQCISDALRHRYLKDPAKLQAIHQELALAFHSAFNEALNESNSIRKETELVREADELWYHLLRCDDRQKLKELAILNIDFLMTVVKGNSISYLRSILDVVRSQVLDWEIELLYNMTKQSVHVVSQDANQLAIEILLWLKQFVNTTGAGSDSCSGSYQLTDNSSNKSIETCLKQLVDDTINWCNNLKTTQLLIPSNSWLNLPMPPQVAMITCTWNSITRAVSTPDSQYLIACETKMIHFYNLPAKSIIKSFEGHRSTITCLHLSDSGKWLVTGSEDTNVNLWEVNIDNKEISCKLKHRLNQHIAGVLCVVISHSEEVILSGSEIGAVCAISLDSGTILARLEHHKGMITCLCVNSGDDVFVTGSTDCTVAVWSLETFCILNEIILMKPIMHMDISLDSTFLLLACEDNSIHVRALTTGSNVHCLQGHSVGAVISYLRFAKDNCRCILGCGDGKLHIYDIHSARLLQTLSAHTEMITAILPQTNDRFLFTCGGNKIVIWNFSARNKDKDLLAANIDGLNPKDSQQQPRSRPSSRKKKRVDNHREPITCVAVSRDGSLAVTGSRDCLVKIWQLSTGETHTTLEGHTGAVTCVDFAPNGLFAVSGSEDKTLRVWGLTLGLIVSTFTEHQNSIVVVKVSSDSRKILSVDAMGVHMLWQADNGNRLVVTTKPINNVIYQGNTVFAISGKNDNSVRFWSSYDYENEKTVSHSEPITCYTCTYDGQTIITGSQDMSLKVWEVTSAKLTQVLVGHEGSISCVATAPLNSSLVISGSQDCNLIVWDMTTGSDLFTLSGHNANVSQVKMTLDGSTAVSASEDNTLQVWDTKTSGCRLAIMDMHHNFQSLSFSLNLNSFVVHLANNQLLPIIRYHNNSAKDLTLDLPPGTPGGDDIKAPAAWRGIVPRDGRQRILMKGALKREQSFDSFYWDHLLHRGQSVDDFRKIMPLAAQQIQSPMGSRDNIWDGSPIASANVNVERTPTMMRPTRMISKLIGPKQKMLKKQQSMFACFSEFTAPGGQPIVKAPSPLINSQLGTDSTNPKIAAIKCLPPSVRPYLGQGSQGRSRSMEETDANSTVSKDTNPNGKYIQIKDSGVCIVM